MIENQTPRLGLLPALIFSSRWLQLPLYLGLIVAQGVYVLLFLKELWHLLTHATSFGEMEIMLIVLGLIDVVMISNLLVMVIVGGIGMRYGGVAGAAAMLLLEEFLRQWTEYWHLPLGLVLLAVVLLAPGGLASLATRRFGRRDTARAGQEMPPGEGRAVR